MAISSREYCMLLMPPCVLISTAIAFPREGKGHCTYDVNIDSSSSSSFLSSDLCHNLLDDRSGALLIFRIVRLLFLPVNPTALTSVGTHIVHYSL
ncbi:hypothetical protein DPMN_029576 [Dreissena polymorpha]|uniref:Uncharacterized protein n=1 Tax=Dreissena polymorpha TaxID=45954 RepID=A0A9D4RH98_DREPO|nr:hypothetical protein DPMN_029576 [Dreissena polymorpha]